MTDEARQEFAKTKTGLAPLMAKPGTCALVGGAARIAEKQLREYGHANQPHLVRDAQQKKKILDVLESATRGLRRMEAVLDRVPEQRVSSLLAKLQAPPLNEIADMPTLVQVVQGLEGIVNGSHPSAA